MSSADRDFGSELVDPAPGDLSGGGGWSINGLRERGRAGGGSSKGDMVEVKELSAPIGEAARLRKGLFDERLTERLAAEATESCPTTKYRSATCRMRA